MTSKEIIDRILQIKGLNTKSFSEKIGLDRPQAIYDIQKGKTKNISAQIANKILSVFPDINKTWLLTGEGPETKVEMDINAQAANIPYDFIQSLMEERKRHDEMTAELIRQNGELIELLKDSPKTNARGDDNVSCAIASGSDLVE